MKKNVPAAPSNRAPTTPTTIPAIAPPPNTRRPEFDESDSFCEGVFIEEISEGEGPASGIPVGLAVFIRVGSGFAVFVEPVGLTSLDGIDPVGLDPKEEEEDSADVSVSLAAFNIMTLGAKTVANSDLAKVV